MRAGIGDKSLSCAFLHRTSDVHLQVIEHFDVVCLLLRSHIAQAKRRDPIVSPYIQTGQHPEVCRHTV